MIEGLGKNSLLVLRNNNGVHPTSNVLVGCFFVHLHCTYVHYIRAYTIYVHILCSCVYYTCVQYTFVQHTFVQWCTDVYGVRVCTTQSSLGWRYVCQPANSFFLVFYLARQRYAVSGTPLTVKCKSKIILSFVGYSEYLDC